MDPNVTLGSSTALIDATIRDNSVAVELLLAHGANVHVRRVRYNGKTALFYAQSEIVAKMLLNAGADVDARTDDGITPLTYHGISAYNHIIAYHGIDSILEVKKTLLDAGASIDFYRDIKLSEYPPAFQDMIVAERKKRAGRVIMRALWKRVQLRMQMELLDELYKPGGLGALRAQERFNVCIKNL